VTSKGFTDAGTDKVTATCTYDPSQGHWTHQDSIEVIEQIAPDRGNRYAYAGDDPVNHVDPSGAFVEYLALRRCTPVLDASLRHRGRRRPCWRRSEKPYEQMSEL